MKPLPFFDVSEISQLISLIYTRFLKKHSKDIMCDRYLLWGNFLFSAEIQLLPDASTDVLTIQFKEYFDCQFNLKGNKSQSIAICYYKLINIIILITQLSNVILWNPNINVQDNNARAMLRTVFHDNELFVNKPTHLHGSIIDQIYLHHVFKWKYLSFIN